MNAVLQSQQAPEIDLTSPAAAQAALRTFWRLAEAWKLDVHEQTTLLGVGRTTLYQWKAGKVGPLDRHVLERLSYLFGIYAALQILLPVKERADGWVREPNAAPLFGGRSALDRMMAGQVADLYVVRHYLDAQRGGKA
ncbi:MAG: MbcA/ParS/Xre antitoxin family protein [Rhizobacter sp.]